MLVFGVWRVKLFCLHDIRALSAFTLEDPIFLTAPFTYAHIHTKRKGEQLSGWFQCDPEVARSAIESTYPEKYPQPK